MSAGSAARIIARTLWIYVRPRAISIFMVVLFVANIILDVAVNVSSALKAFTLESTSVGILHRFEATNLCLCHLNQEEY